MNMIMNYFKRVFNILKNYYFHLGTMLALGHIICTFILFAFIEMTYKMHSH